MIVADVTRWGRFRDPDEAAYYEFLCRSNGVEVLYVDEQDVAGPLPVRGLLRAMHRILAWEFTHRLSGRIQIGRRQAVADGHWTGGPAPLGYRRRMISRATGRGRILQTDEHKWTSADYVVLVPGPDDEVRLVRHLFLTYATGRMSAERLSGSMRRQGPLACGRKFSNSQAVTDIIRNPVYIGVAKVDTNPRALDSVSSPSEAANRRVRQRTCMEDCHTALVSEEVFFLAQLRRVRSELWPKMRARWLKAHPDRSVAPDARPKSPPADDYSNVQLLEWLSRIALEHGTANPELLKSYPGAPPERLYVERFGSVYLAAKLWGLFVSRRLSPSEMLDDLRKMWREHGQIKSRLFDLHPEMARFVRYRRRFGSMSRACELIGYPPRVQLTNEVLIGDLRRFLSAGNRPTAAAFAKAAGKYRRRLMSARFGSFNRALEIAEAGDDQDGTGENAFPLYGRASASQAEASGHERIRAVAYLRRSLPSEVQATMEDQRSAISGYAQRHNCDLTHWYVDQASGLHARTRPQFSALIKAVTGGAPGFSCVLVYDTSRWGRFQDIDEGAYYEFLFKKHGVDVVMVSEQAQGLDRQLAAVLKAVQRAVAAEHSRRLGEAGFEIRKVLFKRGYWLCGGAPLGTKRVMITADGTKVRDLPHGECKPTGSQCRTILDLGAPEEIDLVKSIFSKYGNEGWSTNRIADWARREKPPGSLRHKWYDTTVTGILRSRIYLGEMLRGAYSQRLGAKMTKLPKEQWEYKRDVLPPIIDVGLFDRVQARLGLLRTRSPERMLADLRLLYEKRGHINTTILGGGNGTARYRTYVKTFGSIQAAYEKAGITEKIRERLLSMLRMFAKGRTHIYTGQLAKARGFPTPVRYARCFGSLEAACQRVGITLQRHASPGRKSNRLPPPGPAASRQRSLP